MSRFRGDPEWPEFMDQYYTNHRALLVLFGWTRHLANHYDYGLVDMTKLMNVCNSPEELDRNLRMILKPGDDGSDRSYSHFTENPAAYPLWPKE